MNSQFAVPANEKLLTLPNTNLFVLHSRTLQWIIYSALIGIIFAGLPYEVLTFFQQPLGMFAIIFLTIYAGINYQISGSVLVKLIFSTLIYTTIIQLMILGTHIIWPTRAQALHNNVMDIIEFREDEKITDEEKTQ